MKVGVVTLGCDKNTVDTERYLAELASYGAETADSLDGADVIVVNTCGFIDAAKKESIDALVEAGRLKREGSCRAVVAIGCMVERHREELRAALPEVDVILGTSDSDRLAVELQARGLLESEILDHPGVRVPAGDLWHVRYLKVSEGCDHGCAFCAIPLMRGKHRSFPLERLVAEAQLLEAQGARELNLVAQDLAHYGRDMRDGNGLPELLSAIVHETDVPWIRMLYLYSAGITERLLDVVAEEPRILPYLDTPIQHGSDEVLRRMRRPERKATIREKVARFRDAVPGVAIRTTCIVGFPGETDGDFEQLLELLEEIRFERVGAFTYSPQEGTRAAELADDVPESLKRERLERLLEIQCDITTERYEERLGAHAQAMVDRALDGGRSEARLPWQADDIDGVTLLDTAIPPGTIAEVIVDEVVDSHDFAATVISAASSLPAVARRVLPLMSLAGSSFGR